MRKAMLDLLWDRTRRLATTTSPRRRSSPRQHWYQPNHPLALDDLLASSYTYAEAASYRGDVSGVRRQVAPALSEDGATSNPGYPFPLLVVAARTEATLGSSRFQLVAPEADFLPTWTTSDNPVDISAAWPVASTGCAVHMAPGLGSADEASVSPSGLVEHLASVVHSSQPSQQTSRQPHGSVLLSEPGRQQALAELTALAG